MKHNATFLYCNHCRAEIKRDERLHSQMKREHIAALIEYYTANGDRHLIDANGNFISQRTFEQRHN